jgi:hypothetical protein
MSKNQGLVIVEMKKGIDKYFDRPNTLFEWGIVIIFE